MPTRRMICMAVGGWAVRLTGGSCTATGDSALKPTRSDGACSSVRPWAFTAVGAVHGRAERVSPRLGGCPSVDRWAL